MRVVLILLLFVAGSAVAQPLHIYDLQNDWQVNNNGTYVAFDQRSGSTEAIYFNLDALKFRGYKLELDGAREYSVWVNGKLLKQVNGGMKRFDIDSLERLYKSPMVIGVFATRGITKLKTSIITLKGTPPDNVQQLRQRNYLRDFSILGVFILALGMLAMMRFNRRLLFDYFDFTRLLSMQERDESLTAGRITSRFSILIYVYLSAWCAFLFLIIFQHVSDNWIIISDFKLTSAADGFFKWSKLTFVVGLILFTKVSFVLALSVIFRLREGGSIQVLNYFRLIAFLLMLLSLILIFYFVLRTKTPPYYEGLIVLTAWVMVGWGVVIFLKLLNKSPYSVFHLISYLCASEFFPMIILFKSLFY